MPDYQHGKIYKVVNDLNNIIYVGSTAQKLLCARMGGHRRHAVLQHTTPLYASMRELGAHHFRIVLLHVFPCTSKDELEAEEYKVMKELIDAGTEVFNLRKAAFNGLQMREETKAKLSKARTGQKPTDETRAKMAKSHVGKKQTDETKAKIAQANSGFGSLTLRNDGNGNPVRWIFQYRDKDGVLRNQSFSVKKYGNYGAHFRAEEVRRAAYPEWGNDEDIACDDLGHIEWD